MTGDRVTFLTDPDGYETSQVDEIVMDGRIHLEMLNGTVAFLAITADGDEYRFNVRAEPASCTERRERLRQEQDRLVDHLGSLLPWRWPPTHPRSCLWSVPIRKRPAAAVRDWWEARRYARIALTVTEES